VGHPAPRTTRPLQVAHVVVAGGCVGAVEPLAAAVPYSRQFHFELQPLRDLDMALAELAESLPLDVMPGAADPANLSLPQQPLHKCLFPGGRARVRARGQRRPHDPPRPPLRGGPSPGAHAPLAGGRPPLPRCAADWPNSRPVYSARAGCLGAPSSGLQPPPPSHRPSPAAPQVPRVTAASAA
jgi:hypothetical protein